MNLVANAIEQSKESGTIASIDATDAKQARVSLDAVRRELARECDQQVEDGDGSVTFHGRDIDGNKWRVALWGC